MPSQHGQPSIIIASLRHPDGTPCHRAHGSCPSAVKNSENPRNNTFYALKPHPTSTQCIAADRRLVGRVTPCAPLLSSKRTSFFQPPPSQCFTLKKHIMQVPVFTTCYVRRQSAQAAGRVATGFPLPSTGRGIEGEGWSYPELPPVRFFLYQHHPASKLNTENSPQNPRNITFIALKHDQRRAAPIAPQTQDTPEPIHHRKFIKTPAITLFTVLPLVSGQEAGGLPGIHHRPREGAFP